MKQVLTFTPDSGRTSPKREGECNHYSLTCHACGHTGTLVSSSDDQGPWDIFVWLLSLDGRWFSCTIHRVGGPLWITYAAERVHCGMSGSPIVSASRTAIGVVCTATSPREGVLTRASPTACRHGCSATPLD